MTVTSVPTPQRSALAGAIAELCDAMSDIEPIDTGGISTPLAAITMATIMLQKARVQIRAGGPTPEQRSVMASAIGWWLLHRPGTKRAKEGARPYRNYYCANPDDDRLRELVARGWMAKVNENGGLIYYGLTNAGFEALGLPIPTTEKARTKRKEPS